jgi:Gas vesicle protein K/Gas vesicle protein
MSGQRLALDDGSLVDVLDRLLDVGAYLDGTVLLTLADVDLVRLDLRLLLASIDTLRGDESVSRHAVAATAEGERTTETTATRQLGTQQPATQQLGTQHTGTQHTGTSRNSAPGTRVRPARVRTASDLDGNDIASPRPSDSAERDRPAGIAGLVVVLVDIVRQLLERQAIRRMDAGTLTDAEVERLGQALMALEEQVAELTEFVGTHRRDRPPELFPSRPSPGQNQKEGPR